MRAIVIDDSPTMRAMIKGHLTKLGWSVVGEGENGVEALELVRTLRPDFMTLDIIMPEMDGIECYRHVRQLEAPPRCLIISVLASEPRIIAAYESEIFSTHFLKKPYSEKDLKEKLIWLWRQIPCLSLFSMRSVTARQKSKRQPQHQCRNCLLCHSIDFFPFGSGRAQEARAWARVVEVVDFLSLSVLCEAESLRNSSSSFSAFFLMLA